MARVCVVGISGYVGSHVAAELIKRGYYVNGTVRDVFSKKNDWIIPKLSELSDKNKSNVVTLFSADLKDRKSLQKAMEGCSGVIMSAGHERQEPETINLMVGAAQNVLDAAKELGIKRAVFTSSTGSTNPPGGEPDLKDEVKHWSDDNAQVAAGKYSPAAKTRMEKTGLALMDSYKIRVSFMNPSLIAGPAFQSEPVGVLHWFQHIIEGKQMRSIPNSSMSIIDVRDLAKLHVAALENESASGRYFAVKRSWHWKDILAAVHKAYPSYSPPTWPPNVEPVRATQFDLTRRDSLGVETRDLDSIISGIVEELQRRKMVKCPL